MGTIMEEKTEVEGQTQTSEIGDHQPTCIMPGCNKPAKIRGLCQKHYDSWRKGTAEPPSLGPFNKSVVSVKKTICLIEGCDQPAKARGLCSAHYQAYHKGYIEHPTAGMFAVSQVHHKSKTDAIKKPQQPKPKSPLPEKEILIKSISRSYPFPDIVPLDFTNYPEIKAVIFDTAQKLLLPAEHIIFSMLAGIIAGEKED